MNKFICIIGIFFLWFYHDLYAQRLSPEMKDELVAKVTSPQISDSIKKHALYRLVLDARLTNLDLAEHR
jgi:hypothetical protein